MRDIGFVTSGDGGQLQCYRDYAAWLDQRLYLPRLDGVDLTGFRAVVIPDFSNELLRRHARQINDYLAQGGFLIVFEPNRMDQWLDVVTVPWFARDTEDWKWWMRPDGRLEAYQPEPRHPMTDAIPLDAMCWHFFGAFRFVEGATPILNLDHDEGCLLYDQRLPGGGRVLMHNGDNIHFFCSDPRHQPNLFHDILHGLVFSDQPAEHTAQAGPRVRAGAELSGGPDLSR